MATPLDRRAQGFSLVEVMIFVAIVAIILAVAIPAWHSRNDVCLEWRREVVTTYPYMGMQAIGAQYTALALMPVQSEKDVCVRWQRP